MKLLPFPALRSFLAPLALAAASLPLATATPAAPVPDDAFKADCTFRLKATAISVKLVSTAPDYDYTKTAAELTALHPGAGVTVGLTTTHQTVQFKQNSDIWARPNGPACTRPSLELVVTQTTTVYVAKEFPSSSCSYKETKAHELRHVRAHKDYAELTARQVETEMRQAFGNDIFYGDAASLANDLRHSLVDGWFVHFRKALTGVSAWNALIDSPAEYRRMDLVCNNESNRLLGRPAGH